MTNLQTSKMLRNARESLGLSQAKVSRDTGINRTYLSRFEGGIQVLPDDHLRVLQEHYEEAGFEFPAISEKDSEIDLQGNPTVHRDSCTIMDGFLLPDDYNPIEVEDLLEELKSHEDFINSELNSAPENGFLPERSLRRRLREIAFRGLRCYSIIQEMQGRELTFSSIANFSDIDLSAEHGNLRSYLLTVKE
jgi:transcriptional regulator with XRE-family HTH domain